MFFRLLDELFLSVMVSVPVRVPVAVEVKVTLIVQLALAAKELPQVLLYGSTRTCGELEGGY